MDKVTEVKRIVLNIEGKEVSLSVEQAKKLKELLNDLFGKEIIKEVIRENHIHHSYPYRPYWVYYEQKTTPDENKFYCGTYSANTKAINCSI